MALLHCITLDLIMRHLFLLCLFFGSVVLSSSIPSSSGSLSEWRYKSLNKRGSGDNYKTPPELPLVWNATASSLLDGAKSTVADYAAFLRNLTNTITPADATFANTVRPLALKDAEMALYFHMVNVYQSASSDEALKVASAKAASLGESFSIGQSTQEDMFRLVDHIYKSQNTSNEDLDGESRRLLEFVHRDYISNGLSLPAGAQRDKYTSLRKRISDLQITFRRHSAELNDSIWLTPEELSGVPEDIINSLEKGKDENQGKLKLIFKPTDQDNFFNYALNETARLKVYVAGNNILKENVPVLKEAVVLRDEAARMLGFPNHAAFNLQNKMAHDVNTVNAFLSDLRARLAKGGASELAHLTELKRADYQARNLTFDGNFYAWDKDFYENIMIEKEYNVDHIKVSEYFPLQHTVQAMLQIYEDLFGFVFVQLTPEALNRLSPTGEGRDLLWHQDVIPFSVWDADNSKGQGADDPEFLGYLYLDLQPRSGKYPSGNDNNIRPSFLKADGKTRTRTSNAVLLSLSKPTLTKPALLHHSEVVVLFHELGHAMHDLAGRAKYSRFAGYEVLMDFIEAPSQMLENWCWTLPTLKRLSSHYRTGEAIPDELAQKLLATKYTGNGLSNLFELALDIFDMTIHTPATHADIENMDLGATMTTLLRQIRGMKGPEDIGMPSTWGQPQVTFNHLMAGYDAGLYGYLWSQVYSMDMFYAAFRSNPMDPVVGRRYRHTVLEPGGSVDPEVLLERFLGRKPSSGPFYQELGI